MSKKAPWFAKTPPVERPLTEREIMRQLGPMPPVVDDRAKAKAKAEAEHRRILERPEIRLEMADAVHDGFLALPRDKELAMIAAESLVEELIARFLKRLGKASFRWAWAIGLERYDREIAERAKEAAEDEAVRVRVAERAAKQAKPEPSANLAQGTGKIDLNGWSPDAHMQ
ncbi:hypothetical protein [Rhizobium sp. LjRoot254]|uniref:hypothetical protein n=1 Tax=Rhizobium sp. LjRoot254 TaxID=3342297 RepID=UPI003ED08B36